MDKVFRVMKFAVYAGKPDVGYLVQLGQVLHHDLTYQLGRDLRLEARIDVSLDILHHQVVVQREQDRRGEQQGAGWSEGREDPLTDGLSAAGLRANRENGVVSRRPSLRFPRTVPLRGGPSGFVLALRASK